KKWQFCETEQGHTLQKDRWKLSRNLSGTACKSPDLNPIEDMWSYLDRKVKESKITTIRTLRQKLKKEWENLSWEYIRKSVDSIYEGFEVLRRLEEIGLIINNRGFW